MLRKFSSRGFNLQKWYSNYQNLELSISQETYDDGSVVYRKEQIGATGKDLIGSNFKHCSEEFKATKRRIEVALLPVCD